MKTEVLVANGWIKRMRGTAQAQLVTASDGHAYVVKAQNNTQGRRILINEWIGSAILRFLDIETPACATVAITSEFSRMFPTCRLTNEAGDEEIEPGLHFGSRFPGDPLSSVVFDFLADDHLLQCANRRDFLGVICLDKWLANEDSRQAIFHRVRHTDPRGFKTSRIIASMVDHGGLFGGNRWRFEDAPLRGLFPKHLVYEQAKSLEDFEPWLSRIETMPDAVLEEAVASLPTEWLGRDRVALDVLCGLITARKARVGDLVEQAMRARKIGFADGGPTTVHLNVPFQHRPQETH